MTDLRNNITCWVLTEGIAGTENQCIGIAENLGVSAEIKRISLGWPWSVFSPYLKLEKKSSFTPQLSPPWPDILIASGRKSVAASRYIKKQSDGKTFTVQVQDPRISPEHFDLVAVPEHDGLRGSNVVVTTATPNRVTPEKLEEAKHQFPGLSKIRSPRIAVLIGGNSKKHKLDEKLALKLGRQLVGLNGGLMVTASRRTGEKNRKIIGETLENTDAYVWNGSGENPYFGFLAWADYILVTSDSSSMLSEAASTGKPVYIIELEGGSKKFTRLYQNLMRQGAVRKFEGQLEQWNYDALQDAKAVADRIIKDFSNRKP
jgi:hypothetical protein